MKNFNIYDWKKIKNVEELATYCTKTFGGKYTVCEMMGYAFDIESCQKEIPMFDIFYEACNSYSGLLLKDMDAGKEDAYEQIDKVMRTLHYSNGEPLSCDEYDYFENYDRDQDFALFYNDNMVVDFVTNGERLFLRIDITLEELKEILEKAYDGSDYEHDFH